MKSSKFKGVSWDRKTLQFKSSLTFKRITHHCGYASTEISAVKLRDMKILNLGFDKKLLQIIKPIKV